MAATIPALPALVTPGYLGDEMGAFVRHLRAENLSPNSVYAYVGAVVSLGNYLVEHDLPTDVAAIKREHIQDWQINLLERYKPATAHQRYRGAQRFFAWAESVMDDPAHPFISPMRKMKPPKLDDYLPTVLTLDELRSGTSTSPAATSDSLGRVGESSSRRSARGRSRRSSDTSDSAGGIPTPRDAARDQQGGTIRTPWPSMPLPA